MKFQEIRQAATQGTISLPPPDISEPLETHGILKSCLKVTREISDFRYCCALSHVSQIATRLMTVTEARNQLAKNGDSVSLFDFFLSEVVPSRDNPSLLKLNNYLSALTDGAKTAAFSPLTVQSVVEIANHFPQDAITWRQNKEIGETLLASDTFPDSKAVQYELIRWDRYSKSQNDLEPLVHVLLSNMYFMAIAPLSRHNERIAHILLQLALMGKDISSPAPCLQLSRAMQTNAHFGIEERLYGLRTRQWTPYLTYMLMTLEKAVIFSKDLLNSIDRLYRETEKYLKRIGLESHAPYLPAVFMHPACRTGELASLINTRRQVASHILNDLARAEVLERKEVGRDRIFFNKRLIELLENDHFIHSPFPASVIPFFPLYQKGIPGRQKKTVTKSDDDVDL